MQRSLRIFEISPVAKFLRIWHYRVFQYVLSSSFRNFGNQAHDSSDIDMEDVEHLAVSLPASSMAHLHFTILYYAFSVRPLPLAPIGPTAPSGPVPVPYSLPNWPIQPHNWPIQPPVSPHSPQPALIVSSWHGGLGYFKT